MSDSAGTALGSSSRDREPAARRDRRPGGSGGRIRNIGTFYRQVVAELRKVIWPTRKDLLTYTAVVVVFVAIIMTLVGLLDVVYAKGVLYVFGK